MLEGFVARDEIRLGIHFDHGGDTRRRGDAHKPFRCDAAGFLGGCRKALLAQPINGSFHIGAVFDQRLLAIHHACAGTLAQVTDHTRCDFSHCSSPLLDD